MQDRLQNKKRTKNKEENDVLHDPIHFLGI